jgi:protein SCO1/2
MPMRVIAGKRRWHAPVAVAMLAAPTAVAMLAARAAIAAFAASAAIAALAAPDAIAAPAAPGIRAENNAAPAAEFRLTVWPDRARPPDFHLVDANGRSRTLTDFKGRIVVVFFGFVHCPDVCSTELLKLALATKRMGRDSERVQVLFITLDPERDTTRVLKDYVRAFDPRFLGLTGTTTQVNAAAERFHIVYAKVGTGADYSINHSTSTFILDAAGKLRLIGTMTSTVDDFTHDLTALASE